MARRAAFLFAVLALAGCGGAQQAATVSTGRPAGTATAEQMTVTAYFLRDEKVAVLHARTEKSDAVARASMEALLNGPPPGYSSAVPAGTRLLGLAIDGGTATVDLSQEFESGGGSASMLGRLAQVVYTLTQFPSVERVALEIEGKHVEALGGEGVVLDRPQTRADYEAQTPPILIESPARGDTVSAPVRITGTSNVYEANMALQVFQGEKKLVDTFLTASSGSGDRGTFDTEVPLDVTGPVRIVMYAPSGENGEPQHQVDVPITVAR